MDALIVLLRFAHVVLGVFWAGTIFFFVTLLEPSVRAVGPDGGKVMFQLFSRRYLQILPAAALVTIVSGIWLLWNVSNGFDPVWMGSGMGITLSTGGASAIAGFTVGMVGMRRAALRMFAIMQTLPTVTEDATRTELMNEMGVLRARARASARVVAVLLLIAVMAMAVARYA